MKLKHRLVLGLLSIGITSSVILSLHRPAPVTYEIGERVEIVSTDFPGKPIGQINGTYEYNNYHETNTHTGYRVKVNGVNYLFDQVDNQLDFVKVDDYLALQN